MPLHVGKVWDGDPFGSSVISGSCRSDQGKNLLNHEHVTQVM